LYGQRDCREEVQPRDGAGTLAFAIVDQGIAVSGIEDTMAQQTHPSRIDRSGGLSGVTTAAVRMR